MASVETAKPTTSRRLGYVFPVKPASEPSTWNYIHHARSRRMTTLTDSPKRLGSVQRLERRGGQIIAVTHDVTKTGYKAPNAYGARSVFQSETTSGFSQSKVLGAVASNARGGAKTLMPYTPDAPRNRPVATLRNTIGKRFGPSTSTTRSREPYRGASSITFTDGSSASSRSASRWRTTNQVMRARASVVATVGFESNPGIRATITRRVHESQRR